VTWEAVSVRCSDQICKILFHFPKSVKAEPEKSCRYAEAGRQARQIERALAIQNAPAETVDDADHRD